MKDQEVDIEGRKAFQGCGEGEGDSGSVFECIAQVLPEVPESGRSTEDGEEEEEVEEGKEKVFRDH